MDHYYSKNPVSDINENIIDETISGIKLKFFTGSGVFSKNGIDYGSRLLIETFLDDLEDESGTILDIGCGYGPIGLYAAAAFKDLYIEMADINERSIDFAKKNITTNKIKNAEAFVSDGFSKISKKYNAVLTNPPIRAGKTTVFSFYEGAFEHLKDGGVFYCVIQKKQGAESSQKKLTELFGNCETINRKSGYRILKSQK